MDLHIAIRSDCFVAGIGLVLAKVMEVAKEIRSDDKKRVKTGVKTPINRRSGWGPGGSVVCWRLIAFLGAGDAMRDGPPPGRWSAGGGLLGGLLGGCWSAGGGWAVVIRWQFGGI